MLKNDEIILMQPSDIYDAKNLIILGDSGTGKTELAKEVIKHKQANGYDVYIIGLVDAYLQDTEHNVLISSFGSPERDIEYDLLLSRDCFLNDLNKQQQELYTNLSCRYVYIMHPLLEDDYTSDQKSKYTEKNYQWYLERTKDKFNGWNRDGVVVDVTYVMDVFNKHLLDLDQLASEEFFEKIITFLFLIGKNTIVTGKKTLIVFDDFDLLLSHVGKYSEIFSKLLRDLLEINNIDFTVISSTSEELAHEVGSAFINKQPMIIGLEK